MYVFFGKRIFVPKKKIQLTNFSIAIQQICRVQDIVALSMKVKVYELMNQLVFRVALNVNKAMLSLQIH